MISASPSSASLIGIVLGLICHTTGGPILGSTAMSIEAQAGTPPQVVAAAPISAQVRDYFQSTPANTPMRNLASSPMAVAQFPPDAHAAMPAPAASNLIFAPDAPDISGTGPAISPDRVAAEQEVQLVEMINRERETRGESALTYDPLLATIARQHSHDMCVRAYFDHHAPGPGPSTPMDRYVAALSSRPSYAMVGENIYYRSATDSAYEFADEAHTAFMNSPGHRANILMAAYTQVGVGIYVNQATGEFWVTEMFLRDSAPV